MITFSHRFQRDGEIHGFAVAQRLEAEGTSGLILPDLDLQLTRVVHGFSVEFGDDIANF